MENPETLAILDTSERNKDKLGRITHSTVQKAKEMSSTDPIKP